MDTKRIVIPGELLSSTPAKAGFGTYVSGGKVYASVCGFVSDKDKISVLPFSGPYMPKRYDLVIGYVTVVTPSNWIFDIGCPYEGLLHVSEYPVRVPSEEMDQHFNVGDTVLLKVIDVNAEMKIELTYKGDPVCKKLKTGRIYDIPISKVSRVIGRSGSMISMLKSKTGCEIFVGNNGRIWMNGSSEDMQILTQALAKIERDAKLSGLTDLVAAFIDEQYALLGNENACGSVSDCDRGCGNSTDSVEKDSLNAETHVDEAGPDHENSSQKPKKPTPTALKPKRPKAVGKAVKAKPVEEKEEADGIGNKPDDGEETPSSKIPVNASKSEPKRVARPKVEKSADTESGNGTVRAKRPKTTSLKKSKLKPDEKF
ncbi:exosome complex RNA-binding protein Rrp4 [Methanolapillus millepedarum]|uniref:Exosome complex component Rrp4 n=1 Tax=Methanolapillus millepedarum TaxID=3028296 RepID=A0AA96V1H1_9EURY|nr:Polyribonucleotide nucleotidyltransferase [Methanosarcinaceae archaeon Ac7]